MSPDYTDDAVLVPALRAGDDEAFGWVVERYHGRLCRLARTFVSSSAVADEVVQDTWLAVIEGIERFEGRSTLKTWIYRILMNKARRRGAGEQRSVPFSSLAVADDDRPTFAAERFLSADHPQWPGHWTSPPQPWESLPPERVEAAATLACIRRAIDLLPDAQRVVITLRDVQGWASDEVCDVLGVTPANQRVLLHRARARVRDALESLFEDQTA